MQYETPEIPEGINVSRRHPLGELVLLLGGAAALLGLLYLILGAVLDGVAVRIPFSVEQRWAQGIERLLTVAPSHPELAAYLQRLTDDLASVQGVPQEIAIQVHYSPEATINAVATLGGHIVLYRGLLERLESENALAMVIAHEIAHIKQRHVIQAVGRGILLGLMLSLLFGGEGSVDGAMSSGAQLLQLSYSRRQEERADAAARQTLIDHYGHLAGAGELFHALAAQPHSTLPHWLSTHPALQRRIERVADAGDIVPTPLPPAFQRWLD